ncbi:MAG: WD40 repeat domain-containing protein [Anaerolineae bacterium]
MRLSPSRLLTMGIVVIIGALAACQPGSETSTVPPPGTFEPQSRDVATATPPTWTQSAEQITVNNAPRLAYLGRLDTRDIPSTVFAYAFSPDGTRLAGLNNEQLIAWNLITGQIIFNTARADATQVYYGIDKTEIYTIHSDGQIAIYDADTGRLKETLTGKERYNGKIAYDANNGWLALGGLDGEIKVWDVASRQSLVTIEAHSLQITGLAFSSDGEQLASASDDQTVQVWDWKKRQAISEIKVAAQNIAFAPNNQQLAVGEPTQISLWNTQDGSSQARLSTGQRAAADVLVYSPDSQYIVNGGSIPTLTVWDAQAGKLVNTLPGAGGDANAVAFSHNGELLVTAVLGGSVSLWDVSTMRDETLKRADLAISTRQILYADWSPDGFALTLFDATGPIQVWGIGQG